MEGMKKTLNTCRYAICPEFSYKHPEILKDLVSVIGGDDVDDNEKACIFYLLHLGMSQLAQSYGGNMTKKEEFEGKSSVFLDKARVISGLSESEFCEKTNEWYKEYVRGEHSSEDTIREFSGFCVSQKWKELKDLYDSSDVKYVDMAVHLAKAAINGYIDQSPRDYINAANTKYYAEGCIEIANYLTNIYFAEKSTMEEDEKKKVFEEIIRLYCQAVSEFDDLRGYERLKERLKLDDSDIPDVIKKKYDDLKKENIDLMHSLSELCL